MVSIYNFSRLSAAITILQVDMVSIYSTFDMFFLCCGPLWVPFVAPENQSFIAINTNFCPPDHNTTNRCCPRSCCPNPSPNSLVPTGPPSSRTPQPLRSTRSPPLRRAHALRARCGSNSSGPTPALANRVYPNCRYCLRDFGTPKRAPGKIEHANTETIDLCGSGLQSADQTMASVPRRQIVQIGSARELLRHLQERPSPILAVTTYHYSNVSCEIPPANLILDENRNCENPTPPLYLPYLILKLCHPSFAVFANFLLRNRPPRPVAIVFVSFAHRAHDQARPARVVGCRAQEDDGVGVICWRQNRRTSCGENY